MISVLELEKQKLSQNNSIYEIPLAQVESSTVLA